MEKQDSSPLNNEIPTAEGALTHSDDGSENKPKFFRAPKWLVAVCVFPFLWIAVGALLYPEWWYNVFFRGGWRSLKNWGEGALALIQYYFFPFLFHLTTILTILWLSRTSIPDKLHNVAQAVWKENLPFKKLGLFVFGSMILAVGSIFLAEISTREDRKRSEELEQRLRESEANLKATMAELKSNGLAPVLSQPAKFIYLHKETVESLYGQNEPELVPTIVTVEMKNSEEFKGAVSIENFIKTELGKQAYNSRVEQYQKITKNPERKLKDFLTYFAEKNPDSVFRGLQYNTSLDK